jgi:hypothetical protein
VLDIKYNDAIMILMIALEHYQGLYSEMPARIEGAARTAAREAKEAAKYLANTAAQLAQDDLVELMGNAVNQIATNRARTQQWKALGLGIGTATITLLITGWVAFQQGKEADAGEAYKVTRHESALAKLGKHAGGAVGLQAGTGGLWQKAWPHNSLSTRTRPSISMA